ncbi:TerD family protein [Cereibacter sphaeroides]|uniref:TerD family protein n=1 Tax=Cereibacter sphaeroides TaxID=1063 RepID=UPI001F2D28B4|nr:TerD family protein [Cereibacter sphaeroides]MCE6957753.1 TerD family protein [Cereibacter sphaeroides]MCE6971621.1 TerD family protein [Cereibacter sphaeroides]
MAITLTKGGNISLAKADPSLTKLVAGLGWKPRETDGPGFDLDASLFMLNKDGRVRSEADFIFYKQMTSPEGAIIHNGDNTSGASEGDVEQVLIDLTKVPVDVETLRLVVTIYDAEKRKQTFGQVGGAFMRIVNEVSGAEVVRYDLFEDYSTETAMVFGEIYRNNGEWKVRAVGQGYAGGLDALCRQVGINPV